MIAIIVLLNAVDISDAGLG
ncbi:hypothetical protein NPIL_681551, partial [Nephila pilipes]